MAGNDNNQDRALRLLQLSKSLTAAVRDFVRLVENEDQQAAFNTAIKQAQAVAMNACREAIQSD